MLVPTNPISLLVTLVSATAVIGAPMHTTTLGCQAKGALRDSTDMRPLMTHSYTDNHGLTHVPGCAKTSDVTKTHSEGKCTFAGCDTEVKNALYTCKCNTCSASINTPLIEKYYCGTHAPWMRVASLAWAFQGGILYLVDKLDGLRACFHR
ncbi:hypothetical protein PCANC_04918 [Puccinia coronata f. sp. avenae]|uniref:Cyanovirin-N domain-containing protein n=1 Tax=Puccinia coronata f. sp. avenae TaxID=200324 RepID=A0A2N5VWJ9_9BASI|nr:hypothetical protein PCASD_07436 [Puccinia coronata f. sp. avenae]PLW54332.1 hypothetical protein PCANC_04918 [Puccinia coronata f. sp. avenae]